MVTGNPAVRLSLLYIFSHSATSILEKIKKKLANLSLDNPGLDGENALKTNLYSIKPWINGKMKD